MHQPANKSRPLWLRPRYWPVAALFFLLWLITRLPYSWQMRIGSLIGALALRLARERRQVAETNLALCFPHLDSPAQQALLRAHFDALGKGIVETALCWWGRQEQLRPLSTIIGLHNLDNALQSGRGVILLSAHFTTLELGGRLLAMQRPFHVLYRQHKNALFEQVMHNARQRRFDKAIARNDTHELLASLKANMPVWYAPDQNHGGRHAVFAPFFGIEASTLNTTSRLARLSGAPVVPFFQQRLPGNEGYLLALCPPLENFPGDDAVASARRINELVEQTVGEMPEQYLWVHRRFKTRPAGEASPYR